MGLSIAAIRKNCQSARNLLHRTRAEKFALGSFNVDNQETLKAICRAALNKKSPILVEVNQAEVESIGLENIRDLVDNYKNELGLEIFINLDHSPTVDAALDGIEAGFEFINLDLVTSGNANSADAALQATKEVVNYAKLTGAIVEGEAPYYQHNSARNPDHSGIKKFLSTPENAHEFATQTGIDIFTVSIGNLHGSYHSPKTLDITLLENIQRSVDCGLSIHGGSGVPNHYFKEAVSKGICKVNISTDLKRAYRRGLEKALKEHPNELTMSKLMDSVIRPVQMIVEDKIDLLGSANKTRV